jgi:hypothetical protein
MSSSEAVWTRVFRANPAYELVLLDRLEPELAHTLEAWSREPDFYGLLEPYAGSALGRRGVDRETALLFLTLRQPGRLPRYLSAHFGADADRAVLRLVADGILEVESGGAFRHGAGALDLPPPASAAAGRLSRLSRAALRYGQEVAASCGGDVASLGQRLYAFQRLPLAPRWYRRLRDAGAVEGFLGAALGGSNRRAVERGWIGRPAAEGWQSWHARSAPRSASSPRFKLYVSPAPEALPGAFGEIAEALAAGGASRFKVGADAAGLLRPDRLIAYFDRFERLAGAGEGLGRRLAGLPVHGVPFTAELAADGLLSWGVDRREEAGEPGMSWRFWLCRRLAESLLAGALAREREPLGLEPWEMASARLRLEEVDTDTWAPLGSWRED